MINVSSKPSLMHAFNFGKHIGKKVSEVAQIDPGYLDWMLKQKLQNEVEDEDWIYTLKHYLGK
jgi:exodeoxyribonuclease X